jgi:hypothetical protein
MEGWRRKWRSAWGYRRAYVAQTQNVNSTYRERRIYVKKGREKREGGEGKETGGANSHCFGTSQTCLFKQSSNLYPF